MSVCMRWERVYYFVESKTTVCKYLNSINSSKCWVSDKIYCGAKTTRRVHTLSDWVAQQWSCILSDSYFTMKASNLIGLIVFVGLLQAGVGITFHDLYHSRDNDVKTKLPRGDRNYEKVRLTVPIHFYSESYDEVFVSERWDIYISFEFWMRLQIANFRSTYTFGLLGTGNWWN